MKRLTATDALKISKTMFIATPTPIDHVYGEIRRAALSGRSGVQIDKGISSYTRKTLKNDGYSVSMHLDIFNRMETRISWKK